MPAAIEVVDMIGLEQQRAQREAAYAGFLLGFAQGCLCEGLASLDFAFGKVVAAIAKDEQALAEGIGDNASGGFDDDEVGADVEEQTAEGVVVDGSLKIAGAGLEGLEAGLDIVWQGLRGGEQWGFLGVFEMNCSVLEVDDHVSFFLQRYKAIIKK